MPEQDEIPEWETYEPLKKHILTLGATEEERARRAHEIAVYHTTWWKEDYGLIISELMIACDMTRTDALLYLLLTQEARRIDLAERGNADYRERTKQYEEESVQRHQEWLDEVGRTKKLQERIGRIFDYVERDMKDDGDWKAPE